MPAVPTIQELLRSAGASAAFIAGVVAQEYSTDLLLELVEEWQFNGAVPGPPVGRLDMAGEERNRWLQLLVKRLQMCTNGEKLKESGVSRLEVAVRKAYRSREQLKWR